MREMGLCARWGYTRIFTVLNWAEIYSACSPDTMTAELFVETRKIYQINGQQYIENDTEVGCNIMLHKFPEIRRLPIKLSIESLLEAP